MKRKYNIIKSKEYGGNYTICRSYLFGLIKKPIKIHKTVIFTNQSANQTIEYLTFFEYLSAKHELVQTREKGRMISIVYQDNKIISTIREK